LLFQISGQSREATLDLSLAIDYLKGNYRTELDGYTGDNLVYILDKLRGNSSDNNNSDSELNHNAGDSNSSDDIVRSRRSAIETEIEDKYKLQNGFVISTVLDTKPSSELGIYARTVATSARGITSLLWQIYRNSRLQLKDDDEHRESGRRNNDLSVLTTRRSTDEMISLSITASPVSLLTDSFEPRSVRHRRGSAAAVAPGADDEGYYKHYTEADKLLKIAHILHYISIAILGVFVIQVSMSL